VKGQKTNLAPRIGVSYSLNPKFVVRAGFRLFFGGLESTGYSANLGQNYPYDLESNYTSAGCGVTGGVPVCPTDGVTLEQGLAAVPGSGYGTPSLRGSDPVAKTSYSEQFNLATQYAISNNLSLTTGYVGTLSRHMKVAANVNGSATLV
jgi:hypothetical protein